MIPTINMLILTGNILPIDGEIIMCTKENKFICYCGVSNYAHCISSHNTYSILSFYTFPKRRAFAFTMADGLSRVAERHPHFGLFACGMRKNALQKLKSLKVKWLNRNNVRQLSWDFACADFINPLSCQASRLPNFRKRCAFAVAERHLHFGLLARGQGFTMAEILISLTIIGIIAAITLPSLRANINEKTWATQRKALYSRMSQAISLMPSLNGFGEYAGTWEADAVTVEKDTAAARFVTDGLSKVLRINNICTVPANSSSDVARKELAKCGIPSNIKTMANSKIGFPTKLSELNIEFIHSRERGAFAYSPIDTVAAAFETSNKESIAVFYNPYCRQDIKDIYVWVEPYMCANFVYDLNGNKGPNTVGKDIGVITVFSPINPELVAPLALNQKTTGNIGGVTSNHNKASQFCKSLDNDSRLPNIDELASLFYNKDLFNIVYDDTSKGYWSNSVRSSGKFYLISMNSGYRDANVATAEYRVRCIKR